MLHFSSKTYRTIIHNLTIDTYCIIHSSILTNLSSIPFSSTSTMTYVHTYGISASASSDTNASFSPTVVEQQQKRRSDTQDSYDFVERSKKRKKTSDNSSFTQRHSSPIKTQGPFPGYHQSFAVGDSPFDSQASSYATQTSKRMRY